MKLEKKDSSVKYIKHETSEKKRIKKSLQRKHKVSKLRRKKKIIILQFYQLPVTVSFQYVKWSKWVTFHLKEQRDGISISLKFFFCVPTGSLSFSKLEKHWTPFNRSRLDSKKWWIYHIKEKWIILDWRLKLKKFKTSSN